MIKPRTPAGVLELLPREQIAFQRMQDVIRRHFERFGFLPVETPVFELTELLLTKSGGETERQVYFVQSTGALDKQEPGLPELALRFDLTVPLARYVAQHEHELAFPFRRYQMQRVYRGERQQRGRFREFYQCDIDVIGKDQLPVRHDAELPAVIHAVFSELGIGKFTIQLNHRKLLLGFLERVGVVDATRQLAVLREIDKLDKRGTGAVRDMLAGVDHELPATTIDAILGLVSTRSTSHADALAKIAALEGGNALLDQGMAELTEVLELVRKFGVPEADYAINFSIARGLDYYTGTVYETTLDAHPQIGSICSGGRYDELASQYSKSRLPGVGISIGLTRLFWQLREIGLVGTAASSVECLVALIDDAGLPAALALAGRLRAGGINTEVQLEAKKLARQFQYADRSGIRFVLLQGEEERARGAVAVKDLRRNEQFELPETEFASAIKVELAQQRVLEKH